MTSPLSVVRSCRLPALALLPLLLASAAADAGSNLRTDPNAWLLCGPRLGFSWERPLRTPEGPVGSAELQADRFDVSGKDRYRLQGKVVVDQAERRLAADQIDYVHSSSDFEATGNVQYQDSGIALQAREARGNLREDRSELLQADYRLIEARGNGRAERIAVKGAQADLDALTYSTCNPGQNGWRMDAERMHLDQEQGLGTARNATLRVGDVPVLWLPYASFPIDDRRRSGLLFPSVGYADDSGLDIRLPYYLNLAPHYDATLYPRLLSRRGAMLGAEFRYLGEGHAGQLDGNWLPDDDLTGRDRGSLRIRHQGRFNQHWSLNSDLNHVSDDRYFEDFGDSLTARSTSLLESQAGVYGRGAGWNASLSVHDWNVTDPQIDEFSEPYRQLPRARMAIERELGPWARYGFSADAVAFDHALAGLPSGFQRGQAERYDLQPWIEFPLERAAGYLVPRLSWRHTGYQLSSDWLRSLDECPVANCGSPLLFPNRSPTRSLPIASVDAALNFERQSRLFGEAMLQTLQPRLFYLHVPYEQQDDIPLFDTQELTFGFDQLFRTNRFSGADRQADANQLTLALSSRWFENDSGRERLALSLGQIRYLSDQRVALPFATPRQRDASAYVAGIDVAVSKTLSLGYAHQYDPETKRSTVSGFRGQWQGGDGALANFAYRYRRSESEQLDASFALPITEAWRWVGRWNYSLRDRSTLESFAGLEWQNCCVAFRALGRHYLRNSEGEKNNALYLELELRGLANFGRDTGEFLQRAILGYSR